MIQDFKAFVDSKLNVPADAKILLTISGGADSVVMLDLFAKSGFECGIAHCNFHLRGEESDFDAQLVENLSLKYKMPFFKNDFDTNAYSAQNGISIEMAARELRYNWFYEIANQFNYQFIATAHHQDDVLETFFINLVRGTGIRGLTGISEKSGQLIRPLLFADREAIMNYVRENKLEYRDDASNADVKIIRNKIRHLIIPLFKEINPSYKQNILKSIDNLKDAAFLMSAEIENFKRKVIDDSQKALKIKISKLIEKPSIHPYLFELLYPYGFNNEQINDIEKVLDSNSGKVFISKTHHLVKDRECLIINSLKANEFDEIQINLNDTIIDLDDYNQLTISYLENDYFEIPKHSNVAALDLDLLKFPMVLRKWERGDSFFPLGMDKQKKISDFLIDEKINRADKQQLRVLTSAGKIVWIVGKRIDNRFKITEKTRRIIQFRITEK